MTSTAVLAYIAGSAVLSAIIGGATERSSGAKRRRAVINWAWFGMTAAACLIGVLVFPSTLMYVLATANVALAVPCLAYSAVVKDLKKDIQFLQDARAADQSTIEFKNELIGLKEERIAGLIASLRAADRRNDDR